MVGKSYHLCYKMHIIDTLSGLYVMKLLSFKTSLYF